MIEEKARELGRLIGQTKEFQELKRAEDALAQDTEAVQLLNQMAQLRADAQGMMERGEPTQDIAKQLQELLSKAEVQAASQRLMVSHANADKLMQRVHEWMAEGIEKGAASPIIMLG